MSLVDLGLTEDLSEEIKRVTVDGFSVGRITQEHRERYIVSDGFIEYEAEITGNLRFTAASRSDFPAVGDWVVMKTYNTGQALIHKVLTRKSTLARQSVGRPGELQLISTNIDVAFIVQSIDNNFNINRLERYLTICNDSLIEPVLLISKTDLVSEDDISDAINRLEKRDKKVKYILFSNMNQSGIDKIMDFIQKGKTYCVLGSSGVGKSTLVNNLLPKEVLKTGTISLSTNKGRHITEHRELFILSNGGIIIDTPGMRELGITDNAEGIKTTFDEITVLSSKCRFPDCSHRRESGCAVIEAVSNGQIDRSLYENYLNLQKEQERFLTTVAEKRKKDRIFGKIIKNYNKTRDKDSF